MSRVLHSILAGWTQLDQGYSVTFVGPFLHKNIKSGIVGLIWYKVTYVSKNLAYNMQYNI